MKFEVASQLKGVSLHHTLQPWHSSSFPECSGFALPSPEIGGDEADRSQVAPAKARCYDFFYELVDKLMTIVAL